MGAGIAIGISWKENIDLAKIANNLQPFQIVFAWTLDNRNKMLSFELMMETIFEILALFKLNLPSDSSDERRV